MFRGLIDETFQTPDDTVLLHLVSLVYTVSIQKRTVNDFSSPIDLLKLVFNIYYTYKYTLSEAMTIQELGNKILYRHDFTIKGPVCQI